MTVTATRITDQQVFTTTTWTAGGYTLPLADGAYAVSVSGGGIGTPALQTVVINRQNVAADFLQSNNVPPPPAQSAPTFITQPASISVKSASVVSFTGATATFSVAVAGTPVPTFQWQVSAAGGAFSDISGATAAVYTFSPVSTDSGNQYRAVVTNSQGAINSNPAALTLNGVATRITTRPVSQTVNVGDSITLTSVAVGLNPVIKWESLRTGPGSTYATIAGATSPNYTFSVDPGMAGGTFFYRVTYTDSRSTSLSDSSVAIITVTAAPVSPLITAQPVTAAAAAGQTATLAVASTGFPVATVQWQVQPTASTTAAAYVQGFEAATHNHSKFHDVVGLNSATVTIPVDALMDGYIYRALITNAGGTVTTQTVKLSVNKQSYAANQLSALALESRAALDAIDNCAETTVADGKTLLADLKRLHATHAQKGIVTALVATDVTNRAHLRTNESATLATIQAKAASVLKLYVQLKQDRSDETVRANLHAALSRLGKAANANTIPSDATQCHLGVQGNLDRLVQECCVSNQMPKLDDY